MPSFTPQQFLTAFQTRQACCSALLELSRQQAGMIASDQFADLGEILSSKQALIDHLGRFGDEHRALQRAWPHEREGLPAADRARCEALLADTETLLADLLQEEQSSTRQLVSRRDSTQRELQAIAVGTQAQEAYASRAQPAFSRFDVNW